MSTIFPFQNTRRATNGIFSTDKITPRIYLGSPRPLSIDGMGILPTAPFFIMFLEQGELFLIALFNVEFESFLVEVECLVELSC